MARSINRVHWECSPDAFRFELSEHERLITQDLHTLATISRRRGLPVLPIWKAQIHEVHRRAFWDKHGQKLRHLTDMERAVLPYVRLNGLTVPAHTLGKVRSRIFVPEEIVDRFSDLQKPFDRIEFRWPDHDRSGSGMMLGEYFPTAFSTAQVMLAQWGGNPF